MSERYENEKKMGTRMTALRPEKRRIRTSAVDGIETPDQTEDRTRNENQGDREEPERPIARERLVD